MLRIDNNLLQEIGLGALPNADKNSLLKHIYDTLEMRVGVRLADQMSDDQLNEFERYYDAHDDSGALNWLETNFPNYTAIVQEEFDKLKVEVAQSAPQILAATSQNNEPTPIAPDQVQPQPTPIYQNQPQTPTQPITPPTPDPYQYQPPQQQTQPQPFSDQQSGSGSTPEPNSIQPQPYPYNPPNPNPDNGNDPYQPQLYQ